MYSWRVHVQCQPQDPFLYPAPGKLRTVRYDLLYAGFTVSDTDDYWCLLASHDLRRYMTVFAFKYSDRYGLQVEYLY